MRMIEAITKFPTVCRLLVLHWITVLAFLVIVASYGLGFRFAWITYAGVGAIGAALGLGVTAFLLMSNLRCSKCGAKLNDQLPRPPLAGVDGMVLDKRSREIVDIAIAGKYRCAVCGDWS